MATTEVRAQQIKSIDRNDLDVSTSGLAVIAKIIAGTGVSISSTGVDPGTGDVTITNTGNFVLRSPASASDSTVAPPTDTFTGFTINQITGATHHAQDWSKNGTVNAFMDGFGYLTVNNLTSVLDVSAGGSVNATNAVTSVSTSSGSSGTTCATKDWVVTLKPDSGTGNIIQAQDTSTVGLIVKGAVSSSTDIFQIKDSSGNLLAAVNRLGDLTLNYGLTITASSIPAINITTTGNENGILIASDSTPASGVPLVQITNTSTGGRGQFSIYPTGKVFFGPLTNNAVLAGGFGISGSMSLDTRTVTSNQTIDGTYGHVIMNTASGSITCTLPNATTCKGHEFYFVKSSASNTATLATTSSQTISGAASKAWTTQWQAMKVFSDGSNWVLI